MEKKPTNIVRPARGAYLIASGGWSVPAAHAYPTTTTTATPTYPVVTGWFGSMAEEEEPELDLHLAATWVTLLSITPSTTVGIVYANYDDVEPLVEHTVLPFRDGKSLRSHQHGDNPIGEFRVLTTHPDYQYSDTPTLVASYYNRTYVRVVPLHVAAGSVAEQSVVYDAVLYLGIEPPGNGLKYAKSLDRYHRARKECTHRPPKTEFYLP